MKTIYLRVRLFVLFSYRLSVISHSSYCSTDMNMHNNEQWNQFMFSDDSVCGFTTILEELGRQEDR